VVNSHLHYDHSGGNGQIPDAEVVVQAREWAHAKAAVRPGIWAICRRISDTGQRVRQVEGEYDLIR